MESFCITSLDFFAALWIELSRVTLAASSGKRNASVCRPSVRLSVCPVGILTVTHQRASCDAASVHFVPTVRRPTCILVMVSC